MSGAERQARTRHRRRAGLRVYRVEANEVGIEYLLVATNFLDPRDADDPVKVEAALHEFLAMLASEGE